MNAHLRREMLTNDSIVEQVSKILNDVRLKQDQAIINYTNKFDNFKLLPSLNHVLKTINNFPQDKQDSCMTVLMTGISWAELCNLSNNSFDSPLNTV